MGLFRNKYQIASNRLECWDYTAPGHYFITICIKNMQCLFGRIINGRMQLSPIGKIIADEWQKTEAIRPNVNLDQWIIMPNHIHGIIIITERKKVQTSRRDVSTCLRPNSLGSIVGQFKSVCTKRIWAAGYHDFRWQRNYHDHIIRNEKSLNRIRQYIQNNPLKWELDEYYPDNQKGSAV